MNNGYIRRPDSDGLPLWAFTAMFFTTFLAVCVIFGAVIFLIVHTDSNFADDMTIPVVEYIEDTEAEEFAPDDIFANFSDAVFIIYTYDSGGNLEGNGSGFFIRSDGVAVTNHHVLDGSVSAVIVTNDDDVFHIDGFYNYDTDNDLAVFQVRGNDFPYLEIGDSEALRIGESVYVIGSPHGNRNTFSVSYVSYRVPHFYFSMYAPEDVIQVTAPLYPGSSGGVLLNARGEAVGVIAAQDMTRANVGYVVPVIHLNLSNIENGKVFPLPVPSHDELNPKNISYYENFPIPDFLSVSPNAVLSDDTISMSEIRNFRFQEIFVYELRERHFVPDTDRYDILLEELGFEIQRIINADDTTTVFLYNDDENLSLVYIYYFDRQRLAIGIGEGNAHARR